MSTLRLREPPPERIDLGGIDPAALSRLSQAEAERLPVGTSRRGLRLGDVFAVSLDGGDGLTIAGGSARLDRVGAGLAAGTVHVEGDVGQRLAEGMRGGGVTVAGSAGPFAATAATGGTVTIHGDADMRAGGAVHAARAGLDGATLIVRGRAGEGLGERMRRGLILAGHAGDYAGAGMIAGTIVTDAVGDHPGYGMRRGTLVAGRHGALLPTFVETGEADLVFLRLLARALRALRAPQAALLEGRLVRYGGDLATLGKGELFVPTA